MLSVKNIRVHYGKAMALDGVSLEVAEGSIVSLIGANGSGKSTILRAISGLTPLTSGEIWFSGKRIDGMETTKIVKLGLVHIPEGRKLFPYLTVFTNIKLGASLRNDKLGIEHDVKDIFKHFPILETRRDQLAGTLSGGEQQMLAVARGLMAKPKLILFDEPSIGLSPIMVEEIGKIIKNINQMGVTVLLVEQNISLAFGVASRGYVLQVGKVVLEGEVQELKNSEAVKRAYLGG